MRGPEEHSSQDGQAARPDLGEGFFEELVERASDAVITIDADGEIVYANAAVERLLGYAPDELLGRAFVEFVPERLRDRYDGWFDRYAEGDDGTPIGREAFEVTWLTADDEEIRLSISVFAHGSDETFFTGCLREAPTREESIERLREEEALIEEIFDTSPIAFAVRDDDGKLLRANERAAELVGVGSDELLSAVEDDEWSVYDADGEPLSEEEYPVARVLETGEPVYNEEVVVEQPNGRRVHLSVSVAPVSDEGEVRRVVSAAEDITELKQTQFELERRRDELETELSEVFSRVTDAFFALDTDWNFTYVNSEAEQLLRRSEEELLGESVWDEFSEAVGTTFQREYERAMTEQRPVSFAEYYPPLSTWFEVRAYPSETGLSVYFQDVTERKARERELERYETIVETVEDGIYVVGSDEEFSMVNSSFAQLVGYDRAELVGTDPSRLYDETRETAVKLMQEIIDGERTSATIEHALRTKDGETFPAETTFVVRETEDGEYERVGVTRDITERKARERELQNRVEQQRVLSEFSQYALEDNSLDDLFDEATELVADVLDHDYCKVLELDPDEDELLLRNGVGWRDGVVGSATVAADRGSQAGYTLEAEEPVVVEDLDAEERFSGADLLTSHGVESGISTIIGTPDDVWGILGIHDAESRSYADHDVQFVQSIAHILLTSIQHREHERELRERNERLDAFASMLAHELRNPLEIAQIYLDMGVESAGSGESAGDGEGESSFREVERALDRIEEMIDTLLVVTRRGGDVDGTEPVALGEVAAEWWAEVNPDGNLEVETDREILADPSRLRQLLENLYRNSEEHAGPDVTVRVGDLPAADDTVGFYVADDGPGIPAGDRQEVFDPGYSTSNVGIGFGLAVVQQLVEAHGWTCEITESESGGARFEFRGVETPEE